MVYNYVISCKVWMLLLKTSYTALVIKATGLITHLNTMKYKPDVTLNINGIITIGLCILNILKKQ